MKIVLVGGPLDGREEEYGSPPAEIVQLDPAELAHIRSLGYAAAGEDRAALKRLKRPLRYAVYRPTARCAARLRFPLNDHERCHYLFVCYWMLGAEDLTERISDSNR